MKKAIKKLHLPPREKQCPVRHIDTGLQSMCNDMWLKLITIKTKADVFRSSKNNEWRLEV